MTIPPKYEDVAAQLETERARVTDYIAQRAQTELLLEATLGREAALREELAALRESYEAMRDRKNSIVDLQQRLTVAEQRADEMSHALTIADEYLCAAESLLDRGEDDSFNIEPAIIAVRDALKAALKPAEDPFGVLAETGMTYPEFMRSTFQERHKLTDAECEEFHVWKKNRGKPSEEGDGS